MLDYAAGVLRSIVVLQDKKRETTIVGAFIVFGLVGIVLRRRKISNNVSTTEQPRGGIFFSLCSKCRRRKDKYDEGIDDAGGDNTNMDEDVA